MKKYISHKIVAAAKILNVQEVTGLSAGFRLTLEGQESAVLVRENFYARGGPFEDDYGYLVIYADGYKSWTPSEPFEAGYTELGPALTFSEALVSLKMGLKVASSGWNGKGMWITIIPAGNAMFKSASMQRLRGSSGPVWRWGGHDTQ